jgi:hypothetical protein
MGEDESGWLRLTWGDPTELWTSDWRLAKDTLDPVDGTRFTGEAGNNILVNDQTAEDFVLGAAVTDAARLRASIMLPKTGAVAFGLPGGERLIVRDLAGSGSVTLVGQSGSVLAKADRDVWRGPGQWHELEFAVEPGALSEVLLDDMRVLNHVPCPGEPRPDWVRVHGDIGPAGVADIRIKAEQADAARYGRSVLGTSLELTESLWGGLGAEGMMLRGAGRVPLAAAMPSRGVIRGRVRFESAASARVEIGDASVAIAEGRANEPTTGSLLGARDLAVRLIPPGVWYDLEIRRDAGCIRVTINGVVVADECVNSAGNALAIVLERGELNVASLMLHELPSGAH